MNSARAGWTREPEPESDVVTPQAAASLHGLLDAPGDPPAAGDPLPPLWHWLAFLPRVAQRDLGEDGHPHLSGHIDVPEGSRRMFAGGRLAFPGVAKVGDALRRKSELLSVEEKSGRSGRLVFVTIRHTLRSSQDVLITDEQDLVYRPGAARSSSGAVSAGTSSAGVAAPTGQVPRADFERDLEMTTPLLFRFSALTYNAHRIHYDRRYATEVEGYPGLVVHGPLQAVALAELCRQNLPDMTMTSFSFRAERPAFDLGPIHLRADLGPEGAALASFDSDGALSTTATATFAG